VWKSYTTQCTDDCDKNDAAEGGNCDLAEPARSGDADKTGEPTSNETTQQPDHQVSDETKAASANQHTGQPTCYNPAHDPDEKM
jgi:hypothetical protein